MIMAFWVVHEPTVLRDPRYCAVFQWSEGMNQSGIMARKATAITSLTSYKNKYSRSYTLYCTTYDKIKNESNPSLRSQNK
jgi:hypothetical protein